MLVRREAREVCFGELSGGLRFQDTKENRHLLNTKGDEGWRTSRETEIGTDRPAERKHLQELSETGGKDILQVQGDVCEVSKRHFYQLYIDKV